MFLLSKIIWAVLQPLHFLLLALGVAVIIKSWRATRILVAILLFFSIVPVGAYALHKLERVYPLPDISQINESDIAGIIVLGGAVDVDTSIAGGKQPQLSIAAERLIDGISLSYRFADKPVIFTGGAGSINHPHQTEAEQVKILMQKMNIDPYRFVFEGKSRNTYENARELSVMGFKQKGRWILVTSGFHMVRSVKVFESQGWNVIPHPTNYLEDDEFKWFALPNILGNYLKLSIVVREMIGIMAYKLTGRIS
jgi:uncharacterized SAM-binding protein YcdF (DUF218 family)